MRELQVLAHRDAILRIVLERHDRVNVGAGFVFPAGAPE